MNDAPSVFLFVFATMMLALVVELWAIAKVLIKISEALNRHNELQSEARSTVRNEKRENASS